MVQGGTSASSPWKGEVRAESQESPPPWLVLSCLLFLLQFDMEALAAGTGDGDKPDGAMKRNAGEQAWGGRRLVLPTVPGTRGRVASFYSISPPLFRGSCRGCSLFSECWSLSYLGSLSVFLPRILRSFHNLWVEGRQKKIVWFSDGEPFGVSGPSKRPAMVCMRGFPPPV